ncbi:MAG: hypothetical protein AB7Q16_08905 [Vicinamibacterales bacterium]
MSAIAWAATALTAAVPSSVPQPAGAEAATSPAPLVGRLRIDGVVFRDDRGPVLPFYAHAGDLFSLFVRDPARALAELDAVARAGYHGVRTWSALGCSATAPCPARAGGPQAFWRGREVGPGLTADYYTHVERFFGALAARRLRVVWSQGDVQVIADRRDFMMRMARLDNAAQVIDWIDCGNEAWQTGEPDPAKLAECVGHYAAAGGRALKTLTAAPSEEVHDIDRYSIDPADAFNTHSYRGGHAWDKRRHISSLTRSDRANPRRRLGINSEPPGGGALVSATDNKHELDDEAVALLAVASLIARQAFVWFSGEGVQIDQGLATAPGFHSVPKAVALIPSDVMSYETRHHSGDRWQEIRVLEAKGAVRIDGAQADDGRFAYTIDGPPGSYTLKVARAFEATLCHPATAACEPVSRKAGETLAVSFTRGRILVGRTR